MNNQTFKPDNQTISDLFSCQAIYVIPNYQRQYSWGNEQLEELWNDLYDSYVNTPDECYFLGSIVVVDNGQGHHELVDGQQRITTLMIMLNVLAKTFPNINENSNTLLRGNLAKIKQLIYFDEGINRLQLQIDPNYNTTFNRTIINEKDYSKLKYPSQANLKKDEPEFKFINTAKFFYDKFNELIQSEGQDVLDGFVNFILFKTNIIKTVCTNQSFAIKLFLVLNDRGLELSISDIIKSYILDKYDSSDRYNSYDKETFNVNWKAIEKICNDNDFTIDDFMVYFEYYKLKSNPKKQVTDELKKIIQSSEIVSLVDDMKSFAENLDRLYKSNLPVLYSLRYIPWQAYVMTALASAYQVDYPDKEELFETMRRFFYISWISGKTLNGIKQTSFNLIEAIVDKKSIEEIKEMLDRFIYSKRLIRDVYQNLNDDVYGQNFLKALLLSVEYEVREKTNTGFYKIDNNIHLDHILPQQFDKKMNEWTNIENIAEAKTYIHKLGNLALLQGGKNEEALNHGFELKMKIYQGEDKKESGITAFDTTKTIIDNYNKGDINWDIEHIESRQEYLMSLIENMLDISKEDIDKIIEEEKKTNSLHKWEYKGDYLTNKGLVLNIIKDYINDNNFSNFNDIPDEIKNFKMYSHELIKNEEVEDYTYSKLECNNLTIYVRTICLQNDTRKFIETIKKYYNFDLIKLDSKEQI
jgi:uncharacterized protein with ParB-like and HNH nuclease domain